MPQLIIAALILWFVVYGLKVLVHAKPADLVKAVRRGGGGVAMALGAFLALRGQVELGLVLVGLGAGLWGFATAPHWHEAVRRISPVGAHVLNLFGLMRPRSLSRVRSAMIEMQIDPQNGVMQGMVLAGPGEGRSLASLTTAECAALLAQCRVADPEGAQLLEAYLDRRFPGWRQAGDIDSDAGRRPFQRSGAMSLDEAYETLGLQAGASREQISLAHRTLMKKLHPDHGGSTSLAARVNQAKDVLMRRHD